MREALRLFEAGCRLHYVVSEPSTFILNIAAVRSAAQRIEHEGLSVTPEVEIDEHVAPDTGNRYHRLTAPPGALSIAYDARVACAPRLYEIAEIAATPPERLPLDTLPFLYPSRFCESDQLMRLAWREFGALAPGYPQVDAICAWLKRNVDYLPGSTGPTHSAYDTAIQRAGVCRDFTHLAIAFCRALNIPARFVSGYAFALQPPDFHTVFEAWLGGRWYMFDPTGQVSPTGVVRIGTGRDAGDVSFAFIFGPAAMTDMSVYCHGVSEPETPPAPGYAVAAAG